MAAEPPLLFALKAAEPKPAPTGAQSEKKNYAQRLSKGLAQTFADALRPRFKTVTPSASGGEQESKVGGKRLDVKVMDPTLGLVLTVSIKTYSFQDYSPKTGKLGRWTKNAVRNDHELRGEATVIHQRQPYAVLFAVMIQPLEICDDATASAKSSFAHHVDVLSKRTGRGRRRVYNASADAFVDYGAEDPRHDLFERVYIGLYEQAGEDRGAVRFFDVERPAPGSGRPTLEETISFDELIALVEVEVDRRDRKAPQLDKEPPGDDDETFA